MSKDCPDCELSNQLVHRLMDYYAELLLAYYQKDAELLREKIGGYHRQMNPEHKEKLH